MSFRNNLADRAFQRSTTDDNGIESSMSSFGGARIRISNEPELRRRVKELDEGGWEWRFLAYAEEDKGLLESSSQAGSHCSYAYLEAIRHNLGIAKMACQLEMDAEYELIEDVIMATKSELSRLQKHPELFPSQDIREKFWHSVRLKCNESVKFVISEQEARDHAHEMFQAVSVEVEENTRTPGRDMQRTPWEQFLHNRAPGAEADLSIFAEEGSVQIIPMAAARILMATLEEHAAIIRDIEAQREDLKPYAPSSMSHLHFCGLKLSPDGHLRLRKVSNDLCKTTPAGPLDVGRHGDVNSLETLNLDFAALNQRRPPLRPRMWNCVTVAVHDRPNYGVDSEQRDETVEEMTSMLS
uniref:MAT auxiliary protein 1 n=1 Tax=Letharia aff. columbiana 'rugosa' TaxID=2058381 RepID=A0A7G3WA05_9LECA|nr:MAT auxiliary protein 1 [Letharia aff. columbiana 'rugosa']